MSENNGPGLVIIGVPRNPSDPVIVRAGNNADIEATKREARALLSGRDPLCFQAWIVESVWNGTADSDAAPPE